MLNLFLVAAAIAAETTIPKAQFLEGMKAGLADTFCAEKTYFRSCFSVTKDECAKAISAAAGPCLEKTGPEIPAQLHQPADGQKYGEKIGTCVGAKFEEANAKKKTKAAGCDDPAKWK